MYTEVQLQIALLKQKNDDIYKEFSHIHKLMDKIETHQKWILRLMGSGFAGLSGLMAHGFKWVN